MPPIGWPPATTPAAPVPAGRAGEVVGGARRGAARRTGVVMDAADRVAAGDYAVRVDARGSGEVGRLVSSFNEMTARLHANEAQPPTPPPDGAPHPRPPP